MTLTPLPLIALLSIEVWHGYLILCFQADAANTEMLKIYSSKTICWMFCIIWPIFLFQEFQESSFGFNIHFLCYILLQTRTHNSFLANIFLSASLDTFLVLDPGSL